MLKRFLLVIVQVLFGVDCGISFGKKEVKPETPVSYVPCARPLVVSFNEMPDEESYPCYGQRLAQKKEEERAERESLEQFIQAQREAERQEQVRSYKEYKKEMEMVEEIRNPRHVEIPDDCPQDLNLVYLQHLQSTQQSDRSAELATWKAGISSYDNIRKIMYQSSYG